MVQFASYLRRVLCKTRLTFPRINGPIVATLNLRSGSIFVSLCEMSVGKNTRLELHSTTDATTTNIVGPTMLEVVASVCTYLNV